MNLLINIFSAIAFMATIGPWFYPEHIDFKFRIIIPLAVALIVSIVNYTELQWRHKRKAIEFERLSAELEDTKGKHKALAKQYDIKKKKTEDYKNAVVITKHLLAIALSRKKDKKIDQLATGIIFSFDHIEKENEDV